MTPSLLASVVGELLGWDTSQRERFFLGLTNYGMTDYGGVIELAREVDRGS